MPLVGQVIQPLVEHDVSSPARVELLAVAAPQAPQLRMPMVAREAHRFCQVPVKYTLIFMSGSAIRCPSSKKK